jgi:hypothetical protein
MMKSALLALSIFAIACGSSDGDGGGNGDGGTGNGDGGANVTPPFAQCAGEDAGDALGGQVVCFSEDPLDPLIPPVATIEHEFVTYEGVEAVHFRLTFDPNFVDNTYGMNIIGWDKHSFGDLRGSDHAVVFLVDATGELIFELKLDYIHDSDTATCGFASGGVTDGDGKVELGDESAVLAVITSLDRNLNERGYCDYIDDSPATDENCTPNPDAPNWDFRVVYDVWVALSAFPNGFGSAHMDSVHASPAKEGNNTLVVEPVDCPEGLCNDPDGCDNGGGDPCDGANMCATDEFCYQGTCLPIID